MCHDSKCRQPILACSQFEEDIIAVEPLQGWRGAQTNQSLKALQWLAFEEQKLLKEDAADRIRHVKNSGEKTLAAFFVDGSDERTGTFYEFHGCLYHGCPKMPSRQKRQKLFVPR